MILIMYYYCTEFISYIHMLMSRNVCILCLCESLYAVGLGGADGVRKRGNEWKTFEFIDEMSLTFI